MNTAISRLRPTIYLILCGVLPEVELNGFLPDVKPVQTKRKDRCDDAPCDAPAPKRFAMGPAFLSTPPRVHALPHRREELSNMPQSDIIEVSDEVGQLNEIPSGMEIVSRCHLFELPVETIYEIGQHADTDTVHTLTAVCAFLANCLAPLFFKRQRLQVPRADDAYPMIFASTLQQFNALHVWRRTSLFRQLKRATITLRSEAADAPAGSLRTFFESLHGAVFTEHLTLFLHSPSLAAISTVMQSIVGCKSLAVKEINHHPSAISIEGIPAFEARHNVVCRVAAQIDRFTISSPLLFTPSLLQWTFTLLACAKLRDLGMQNAPLLPLHWAMFLRQVNIPTLKKLSISTDVPAFATNHFLLRHPGLESLVFGGTSSARCLEYSGLGDFRLPHLQELGGPLFILQTFLDAFEPSPIANLTIEMCPVVSSTAQLVQDILNHPSCCLLSRLRLAFYDPVDTSLLEHLNLGYGGSPVQHLIITHGRGPFSFTETALTNCLQWIKQFPQLGTLRILDDGPLYTGARQAILRSFAEVVCSQGEIDISVNWDELQWTSRHGVLCSTRLH